MSVNLAKFKYYLDEKDYEAMRKELRTLPKRPGQMATWAIRTDHADDIYFKLYYTPLVGAAFRGDVKAIKIINEVCNDPFLFTTSIKSLESCLKFRKDKNMENALALLLVFKEHYFSDLEITYSKDEKNAVMGRVNMHINSIESVQHLLNFYQNNITKNYLVYRRNPIIDRVRSFFQPQPSYTTSKADFIELLQHKAIALLKKTPTQAIAQQLIESNLFNEIHYQRGVKTSHLLGILNQYRNSDGQLNSCAATGNSPN